MYIHTAACSFFIWCVQRSRSTLARKTFMDSLEKLKTCLFLSECIIELLIISLIYIIIMIDKTIKLKYTDYKVSELEVIK